MSWLAVRSLLLWVLRSRSSWAWVVLVFMPSMGMANPIDNGPLIISGSVVDTSVSPAQVVPCVVVYSDVLGGYSFAGMPWCDVVFGSNLPVLHLDDSGNLTGDGATGPIVISVGSGWLGIQLQLSTSIRFVPTSVDFGEGWNVPVMSLHFCEGMAGGIVFDVLFGLAGWMFREPVQAIRDMFETSYE